jgi:exodeoxyribonuclease VII large subunit
MRVQIQHLKKDVQLLERKLVPPSEVIEKLRSRVERAHLKLNQQTQNKISKMRYSTERLMGILDSLSPLKVVDRGYSITTLNKAVVKSVKSLKKGDHIDIRVTDGTIKAEVINKNNNEV